MKNMSDFEAGFTLGVFVGVFGLWVAFSIGYP